MTNPWDANGEESRPAGVPRRARQPWTPPTLRTLPVGRTETGFTNLNFADGITLYTS